MHCKFPFAAEPNVEVDHACHEFTHIRMQYLGIPLLAGMITRALAKNFLSPRRFNLFLQYFSPLTLLGLLYTIIVLFANQVRKSNKFSDCVLLSSSDLPGKN